MQQNQLPSPTIKPPTRLLQNVVKTVIINIIVSVCVYRSTGIRDDLLFLLDEELSSIQLCALHMEMRNTEQLLASIGLIAYKVDSLQEANSALKPYGPESYHGDRITVKKKADQQSAISKNNIHVSSMSG